MADNFPTKPDAATSVLLERAMQQLRARQWEAAATALRQVLERSPDQPTALQLLGVAAFESGRGDDAVRLLQRAVAVSPNDAEAHYNLANVFLFQGRLPEAEAGFRRVLALDARHLGAWLNLSGTLGRLGRLAEALQSCRTAVEIDPRSPLAHRNYAGLLKDSGRAEEAVRHYQRALALDPASAETHNNLGLLYREQGQFDAAVHAFEQAVRADPGNPHYHVNLRDTYRRTIPSWHFAMLADTARNDAFERAIAKAVHGRRLVLDIGTGSGLLAMMAARAGAGRVVACEAIRPLAQVAARIVAQNGFADRITVIAKRSTELAVGGDLPEPADLLISEILDAGLLGEGVMRTFRHAGAALLAADAAVVPAGATVRGVLIECPHLRRVNPVAAISGFDLRAFDIFRNPVAHRQFAMAHEPHRALSEPFEMARFDFRRLPDAEAARMVTLPAIADGTVQAVAFWFDLHLDEAITLSTGPDGDSSHWRQAIAFFDRDRPVRRGETLRLSVGHTDSHFVFGWPDSPP
ncbi:MAG: tetratricopeptide repeat protein [Dongiaceae bacterium]